jgi:antitoxin HicB
MKEVVMFGYPALFQKEKDGYVVSFRDLPEALTSGATKKEAIEMAGDALATAMEFYFEDRRQVPMPSKAKRGEEVVELSASVGVKVLLLNEMLKENVSPSKLAKKLDTSPQAVTRIVDLHHATKIDTLADAFKAMGKTLTCSVA